MALPQRSCDLWLQGVNVVFAKSGRELTDEVKAFEWYHRLTGAVVHYTTKEEEITALALKAFQAHPPRVFEHNGQPSAR